MREELAHNGRLPGTGALDVSAALPFIVDELPLGIVAMDCERRVVLLNRSMEALTGFDRRAASAIACRHIIRGDFCMGKCPVHSISQGSGMMCVEGNIINRERQKIPVRVTFTPIRDSGGRLMGFFETFEDIRILAANKGKTSEAYSFGQLVGRSPQMEQIYRFLPMIAQSDSSVLLTGETGTGKDLVAEAIHQNSSRAKGPFIKVNCGALPATLLESELFGHQKGAFTGAVESKPGRFRLAHNGTLFLAEIGDLPLTLQVKLLTFLDDRVVHPLGSTKGLLCDVRVIAATHRDLEQMVREGTFREDLLFRLNVIRLQLPSLRERRNDIQLLLDHFLQTFSTRYKKPIRAFSANALRILLNYAYPGNVRELKNIVEYAANVCQENQIRSEHLPAYLIRPITAEQASADGIGAAGGSGGRIQPEGKSDDSDRATRERKIIIDAIRNARKDEQDGLEWPEIERKMIVDAIVKAQGRRNRAAGFLGWSRSKLYRKMLQHGIGA
ncbi:MAG: sigma-54 interaction domain-containing protein [Thermodesulfobacteriota bacterium]